MSGNFLSITAVCRTISSGTTRRLLSLPRLVPKAPTLESLTGVRLRRVGEGPK
jgi:hypothetical protein